MQVMKFYDETTHFVILIYANFKKETKNHTICENFRKFNCLAQNISKGQV
jgi:hypothetical protein